MRLGIPKNLADYMPLTVDGIDVYLPEGFETPFALTVGLNSLFGFKTLNIEGWKII